MTAGSPDHSEHQVAFLEPDEVREVQRYITPPASSQQQRDEAAKRKDSRMLTATFSITVILIFGVIVFSIWLSVEVGMNGRRIWSSGGTYAMSPTFSFNDMFNISMQPKVYHLQWLSGSVYCHIEKDGSLISRNLKTKEITTLANSTVLNGTRNYVVSEDMRFILIANETKKVVPDSLVSKYHIYDRDADTVLSFPNDEQLADEWLHVPSFIPKDNALVFVYGNNLYYQRNPFAPAERVTTSGQHNVIYNGFTDRAYRDVSDDQMYLAEILSTEQAYWTSASGRYIAYLQLNCSGVPLQYQPYYGSPYKTESVEQRTYPCSQAGNKERMQTRAELYIVDTEDLEAQHVWLAPPQNMINRDHYIVKVKWRQEDTLAVIWSNRPQNQSATSLCDVHGLCHVNHEEMIAGGWIEPWPPLFFINNGAAYLTILLKPEGETGEWPHVALVTAPEVGEGTVRFITSGQEIVKSIEAFNEDTQQVYYVTTSGDPKKQLLYRMNISAPTGKKKAHKPECMSCNLEPVCNYCSASFSSDSYFFNLHCLGPHVPYNLLMSTDGTVSEMLEENSELKKLLSIRDLPRISFYEMELGEGYKGWAKVIIPPESDRDQDRKWYPVVFESPSEPGGQYVDERFALGYPMYLASSHNMVYVRVDVRGTSGRGARYKHQLFRRLATVDVDDQMMAARWMTTARHMTDKLLTNMRIADKKRFAIWGSAYGGLLAVQAVANESTPFNCAAMTGGISDMRFFSSLGSERYMGYSTNDDNKAGYEKTNLLNKLELLRGKKLLITHGTADSVVPFTSSASLMHALNEANIQHTQHVYPDLNHEELMKSHHFYKLLTDFLENQCFQIDDSF